MPRIGTPLSSSATRVLLCGSGELGKEVMIALQRLGVETIAVDRYDNTPFRLAYVVRAVSPGVFHHPAASVEDMYRPDFRARSEIGTITISE